MTDPNDPTMPAPPLTDDMSFTPPEQPPMLDEEAEGEINGVATDDMSGRGMERGGASRK